MIYKIIFWINFPKRAVICVDTLSLSSNDTGGHDQWSQFEHPSGHFSWHGHTSMQSWPSRVHSFMHTLLDKYQDFPEGFSKGMFQKDFPKGFSKGFSKRVFKRIFKRIFQKGFSKWFSKTIIPKRIFQKGFSKWFSNTIFQNDFPKRFFEKGFSKRVFQPDFPKRILQNVTTFFKFRRTFVPDSLIFILCSDFSKKHFQTSKKPPKVEIY